MWDWGRMASELQNKISKAEASGNTVKARKLRREYENFLVKHPPWDGKAEASSSELNIRLRRLEKMLAIETPLPS